MEEVKRRCRTLLQFQAEELHCGAQASLHRPTNVHLTLAFVSSLCICVGLKSLNSEESDEKPENRAERGAGPPSGRQAVVGRQPTKYGQPGPRIPASLLFRITPILIFA